MKLPDILSEARIDDAAKLVRKYYGKTFKDGLPRTGSRFDTWAGGGDKKEVANRITADDIVAVSFLSIDFPPQAAIGLLDSHADKATEILECIPANIDLAEVKGEDREALIGNESAAQKLWELLRGTSASRWGVGPTTASKIRARKRPRLIPIYDSVVGPLMGLKDSAGQWNTWHEALAGDSPLPQRLTVIRELSGISEHISNLRTMDVVLWMHGKNLGMGANVDRHRLN
ncbi:DUF6308 family protein [Arthrobacter sp. NA-172]|uniref:DUF6308 family protein n=1 Tax=Arthrobacter sp. NA-172 TaxID=3367524 RepID=UPI003754BB4B